MVAFYMINKADNETLEAYLSQIVFAEKADETMSPDTKDVEGFEHFMNVILRDMQLKER